MQAHPGARASRPHALPLRSAQFPCDSVPGHPAGGNGRGSAQAESWRHCRSSRVEEMAETVPTDVRAGRPRSRVGFLSSRRGLPVGIDARYLCGWKALNAASRPLRSAHIRVSAQVDDTNRYLSRLIFRQRCFQFLFQFFRTGRAGAGQRCLRVARAEPEH